jgi:hypothetical protein
MLRRQSGSTTQLLTSNHVHLLLDTLDRQEMSRFMQEVASEFARGYNRRKHRLNAVWGDNYHAKLRANLNVSLADWIARDRVRREPCWTESLAVGSRGFVGAHGPAGQVAEGDGSIEAVR